MGNSCAAEVLPSSSGLTTDFSVSDTVNLRFKLLHRSLPGSSGDMLSHTKTMH